MIDPAACSPPLQKSEAGGWDLEVKLADLTKPLNFPAIFGREARVEVEIGCGTGIFMAYEAARRPDVNFLGIEKVYAEVRRAKDKWRRRELLNTRIACCDAHYFLEEFASPESIDAYIILYSDPWPKKKHHRRRLFQPRILPIIERTLKHGGLLTIKTDVTEYYTVIKELFSGAAFLKRLTDQRIDIEPIPDDIETNFQRKAREKGHPLHLLVYERL